MSHTEQGGTSRLNQGLGLSQDRESSLIRLDSQSDLNRFLVGQSKRLSWLLRHGALREGLEMDEAGWVRIDTLLKHVDLDLDQLMYVVRENNKARFELSGERIRATQGHSLDETSVTQDGLEASWSIFVSDDDAVIWHATQFKNLDSIREHGILRGSRSHVHLAASIDSKVGKRTGAPILISISVSKLRAEGYEVFESPNGVVLTRHVPPSCLVTVRDTRSRRSRSRAAKRAQKREV